MLIVRNLGKKVTFVTDYLSACHLQPFLMEGEKGVPEEKSLLTNTSEKLPN